MSHQGATAGAGDPGRRWSRRPAALVAAAVLAGSVVAVGPAPASAAGCGLSGAGTPADPYLVASAADLALVGAGDCALSASYLQTEDITLVTARDGGGAILTTWEPIGDESNIFVGTYDGGGNTLTFEDVTFTSAAAGLFDVVGGATIRNLTIDGSFTGRLTGAGIGTTGAIAAQVRGATTETLTIEDVTMAADITGKNSTGGLLGLAEFLVEKPKVIIRRVAITGDVTGGYGSGGIIGSIRANDLIISDAEVSGTVTSTVANAPGAWAYLGGFIGEYGGTGTISNSLFTGSIVADAEYVGGFIGGFRQGPFVAGTTLTITDTSLMGDGTFATTSRVSNWGGAIGFAAYTDGAVGPYDARYGTLTLNRVGVRRIFSVGAGSTEINCLAGIDPAFYPGSAVVLTSSAARGFRIGGVETDCGGRWGEVTPTVSRVALSCTPDPVVVGGTVTCEVTGADADFDFIWAAGAGASATRGVVTTDATGRGTFTFIALRDALGRFIGVELVAWGVTSGVNVIGRAPGAIPAGTGPAWPAVALASALLGGVLALPLLRRRRVTSAG